MASFLQAIDFGIRGLLYTKFEDILDLPDVNNGVIYYPKDIAFRKISEKKGATITEFVNVWRAITDVDWTRQRTPVARRGMVLAYTDGTQIGVSAIKSVPVKLEYNVWFWTKYPDKINLIAERYLFWQHTNPNLNLLYNDVYPLELDLHFGALTDESETERLFDRGSHFCMRVPINIDGWVFTDFTIKTIKKIILTFYDQDDVEDYSEIVCDEDDSDYNAELADTLKFFEKEIIFS